MTKRKQYRRYSPEFKKAALKRAAEEDVTDVQVCQELGISARQLRRWRDELRLHGESAFPGKGQSHDEELTCLSSTSPATPAFSVSGKATSCRSSEEVPG